MDFVNKGATGATATVTLDFAATRAPGGNVATRGKTLFCSTTGTAFTTVTFEVSADGTNWIAGIDEWGEAPSKLKDSFSYMVVGVNAPYLRVRGAGGDTDSELNATLFG